MSKKNKILFLPIERYPCLETFIVITYFFTIFATLIIGIQLLTLSLGIKLHALIDLSLLEPYLTNDSTILLSISMFVILCSSFGLISIIQRSYAGVITALAILVLVLCFTDLYVISGQRVKNYLFTNDLHNLLFNAMNIENFAFHLMQNRLSCCGINDYTDWINVINFVPGSCCGSSLVCNIDDPLLYQEGCMRPIESILSKNYENTINVIVALNVVGIGELFAGFCYSYLLREPKQNKPNYYGTIPRVQLSQNFSRNQTSEQFTAYVRPSYVQTDNNQITPTQTARNYPNLYIHDMTARSNDCL